MPFPENPIDLSPPQEFMDPRISVGRHTYGLTQDSFVLVQPWERIEIGSYCSFAEEVKLFGGAEHEAGISTFPIASKLIDPFGEHLDAATKGPLRIGNDCWVGMGAKVLSGVTIGDGAIVGAGAVVTRDVPPYAVVAGNPARVVRMRFDEHTVERLLEMRWWDWDEDEIMRRAHLLKDADAFLASIDQPPPLSGSPDPGPELLSPYRRYCDLLAHSLVGLLAPDPHSALAQDDGTIEIVPLKSRDWREIGYDWPVEGETMVGLKRLDNIRECVLDVIRRKVPGHLIETGVWRGGSTIFMRALLRLYGVSSRRVYVADSFQGLPEPDASAYPADAGDRLYAHDFLRVSEDEVRGNFARYGLLDDQVCFVPGWFRDTLPQLDGPFAVIRLDGDMYESTMVALESLYPKLSDGGYCIVDDFVLDPCREAVEDYRARQGVTEPIQQIDWTGAYWQKRPPA